MQGKIAKEMQSIVEPKSKYAVKMAGCPEGDTLEQLSPTLTTWGSTQFRTG
jgi:hypothetical protein